MIKLNENGQKAAEAFTSARLRGLDHRQAESEAAVAVLGAAFFCMSVEQVADWTIEAHNAAMSAFNTTIVRSDEDACALLWNTFGDCVAKHRPDAARALLRRRRVQTMQGTG